MQIRGLAPPSSPQLEMERDTFVRWVAQAKASQAAKNGAPYSLRATNISANFSVIVRRYGHGAPGQAGADPPATLRLMADGRFEMVNGLAIAPALAA